MSRSVYRYNVSLCYLCVSLTVSVVSVKRQEVTETAKSVTETSRTYRNFTMAVLYRLMNFYRNEFYETYIHSNGHETCQSYNDQIIMKHMYMCIQLWF